MMKRISYYFSVLSPFTYLAGDKLERIAESHGADIEYLPMDIMALFAKNGRSATQGQARLAAKVQVDGTVTDLST